MGLADEIAKLQQLKEAGALTDEEFQAAKRKLLADDTDVPTTDTPSPVRAVVHDIIEEVSDEPSTLGQAANRYVDYKNTSAIIGAVVFVIFIIIMLIAMLSSQANFDKHFNSFPSQDQFPRQGW